MSMILSIKEFYEQGSGAVRIFEEFIKANDLSDAVLPDHICYKCESTEAFENLRGLLEPESLYLYQSYIAGRRIANIKLARSFTTTLGSIDYLELSDQKPDGSQQDGFDHIEIYPKNGGYGELVSHLKMSGLNVKEVVRPHHTTYDIELKEGFIIRLSSGPLMEKIKSEEMS